MIYSFGDFRLDPARAELLESGTPQPLEPQVFDLLVFLVANRDRLVTREEIFEHVWSGRVVSDSALASRIKSLRKALDDDGHRQRYIRTIHGKGFRFVADVTASEDSSGHVSWHPAPVTGETPANLADTQTDTRPSIAVLPFRRLGGPSPFDAIAEGLPHELIIELARQRWLLVIARGSSFRLREKDQDTREVGRLLSVRYCLTGTVEITGQRLEIITELSDTRAGDVVWGERYSGFVDDIHELRTEIRARILSSLEVQISMHEAAAARLRSTEDLDAWSAYHLGLQHIYLYNSADNAIATRLFEHAVERDRNFARAHAGLSFVHFQNAFMNRGDDIRGEIALARSHAQRGIDIDNLDPFVNFTMGRSYWLDADLDRSLSWLERATAFSPNYAQGLYAHAWTEIMAGAGRTARDQVDLAMRLSPLDPLHYAMLGARGMTHIAAAEYDDAILWAERAARSPGAHAFMGMIAAATRLMNGDEPQAKAWAADVRSRIPGVTLEDFFRGYPIRTDAIRSKLSVALRQLKF